MRPVDALSNVLLLLLHEDDFVEEFVQSFVGRVDAELLKAVVVEVLESGEVQDPDVRRVSESENTQNNVNWMTPKRTQEPSSFCCLDAD